MLYLVSCCYCNLFVQAVLHQAISAASTYFLIVQRIFSQKAVKKKAASTKLYGIFILQYFWKISEPSSIFQTSCQLVVAGSRRAHNLFCMPHLDFGAKLFCQNRTINTHKSIRIHFHLNNNILKDGCHVGQCT